MCIWKFTVVLALILCSCLPVSGRVSAASLVDIKVFNIAGGLYEARLLNGTSICVTQGHTGFFAFIDTNSGKIDKFRSELGENQPFSPTLVSSLAGNALMLDEASNRLHQFAKDGNSISSCGLASSVLATQYGSPADIIPAGSSFKKGFWILTERGFILRVNSDGALDSSSDLRTTVKAPGAFFARLEKRADRLCAFSYNTSQLFEVTTSGSLVKTYDLLSSLGGEVPPSDALLLEDGRILAARGHSIFMITSGKAEEVSLNPRLKDSPLFLDKLGEHVLIFNHSGELLVGSLK